MLFLFAVASATELRVDTNTSDTYDEADQVAWLEYPECAITVLEADAGDLPLAVDYVYVFLGTNTGNQDGDDTLAEVGIQVLADGEIPNTTHMEWGPEAFSLTVSSDRLAELSLVDEENGLFALDYTEGRIAVWVCAPDPETGSSWPRTSERDTSGIVIDTDSPSGGNYLLYDGSVQPLSDFVRGSWIIRASAGAVEGDADTDTDADTDADTDTDTDTDGVVVASVTPATAAAGEAVSVAVLGEGFQDGATVFIGGLAVSGVQVSGDTAISGTSPSALPAGTHDVVVNNPDGSSDTLEGAFTVTGGCGCDVGGVGGVGPLALLLAFGLARRRR